MPTACITGASSGIGKEFAAQLAARGYNLILVARNTKALEELAAELACKCRIISCDLSKEAQCMQLAEELKPLDIQILINNAGFGDLDRFAQSDLSKSLDMINVNIKALHILTRKLLPELMKKDRGYILNVAPVPDCCPADRICHTYYATKAYVTSLTNAIYQELQEVHSNVHISMLCPGPVNTNFNETANVTFALPGIFRKTLCFLLLKGKCQKVRLRLYHHHLCVPPYGAAASHRKRFYFPFFLNSKKERLLTAKGR